MSTPPLTEDTASTPSGHTSALLDRLLRDCIEAPAPGAIEAYTDDARMLMMYAAVVEAFPDARFSTHWRVVDGRRGVVGGVLTGTHRGTWRGVAATGRAIEVLATMMFEFADGRLVDLNVVTDSLAVAEQMGAVEPLGPKACQLPSSPPDPQGVTGRISCADGAFTPRVRPL